MKPLILAVAVWLSALCSVSQAEPAERVRCLIGYRAKSDPQPAPLYTPPLVTLEPKATLEPWMIGCITCGSAVLGLGAGLASQWRKQRKSK